MAASPYDGLWPYGRFAYREQGKEEEMEMIYRFEYKATMGSIVSLSKELNEAYQAASVVSCVVNYASFDNKKEITMVGFEIKKGFIHFSSDTVSIIDGRTIIVKAEVMNEYMEKKLNESREKEAVNHPSHYNIGKFEVIDVIHDWKHGFNLGNAVKYLARAGHKDKSKYVEDLKKAIFYIQDEIKRHEKKD